MDQILQILIQNGYIDDAAAKDLMDLAKTESKTTRQLVIDQGILDEDSLLAVMAAYQDTEAIDLGSMTIDTEVTNARSPRRFPPRRPACTTSSRWRPTTRP